MQTVKIGDSRISYKTVRTNRRTLGISIYPDKRVIVRSPRLLSERKIAKMVRRKAGWILDKLARFEQIKPKPTPKEYLSGEKLLYIGRRCRIKVKPARINKTSIKLYQGKFFINYPGEFTGHKRIEIIKRALEVWYRQRARRKFLERIQRYKNIIGVEPNKIYIKSQKSRWGSCSSKKNINLNYRLIMAPMSIVDCIIAHELVHLKHPNHSKDFWSLLATVIPDYHKKKEWLRVNGLQLVL